MSQPQPDDTNIIDLTGDPDTPPHSVTSSRHTRPGRGGHRSRPPVQEIIDVDELDDQEGDPEVNLDDTSPDVELVSVRPRPVLPPPREGRGTEFGTDHALPAVPGRRMDMSTIQALSHHFVGLHPYLPRRRRRWNQHFTASTLLDPRAWGIGPDGSDEDDIQVTPQDFRIPNPNFETTAFQIGREAPQPAAPTYGPPVPPKEGFTRSPSEDAMLVCPNCDQELGEGEDELKRQVWAVRSCGHVGYSLLLREFLSNIRARSTAVNVQSTEPRGTKT